ncbi:response regulator [uncultured Maricaulis sp.]|uniref:response regulator n=1 Tax=uncultured Maricaulis sp. TaxID=174710 RepID=UPI0030D759D7|tara:strand:- start:38715 stop:40625 length:1911 start_codon:yes stop_codon:yes gene_type:complete
MTRETPPDSEAGPEASKPGADEERFATAPGLDAAEFLISALDATGELILVRGRGGRVVHVNAAFIAAFGGVRTDWVGRWFSVAPPVSGNGPRRYEMLMRTRQGPLWIEWDERLLPDGRGVISVGRDVSSRREAHADLEASQRAKSLFFAAVTHEMRTPLAGALGIARLLDATPLRPDQADYVRTLASSAEHALAMVDDILDLSRLEAGKLTLRPERVDIAELVRETAELAAPRAQEKGLEIGIVQSAAAPGQIEGDPARLRQILFNLIGNAVKFTRQGGIRIEIGCAPAGDGRARLSLSVSDTGPGISELDQQSLFEHFERGAAERDGAESGAGLGLAMVRRLVEAMDSSMGVESRLGEGAKFWVIFDLPVFAGGLGEPMAGRELAVASPNAVLRQTLADQLRELGGDVIAIDRVDNMPAASGRELLLDAVWARHASQAHARHVWQLVTPAGKDDVIEDRPDGVNGWLVKPVRLTSLVEQITGTVPAREPGPATGHALPLAALDGLQILVAEDDPVNALIARRTLERLGAHVTMVETGPSALRALEAGRFDAALLDQRMPGMNGPDVARMARMSGHDLPLVALTANSSEDDRRNCLEAGMNDFLSKPVDPDLLARTLARLCEAGKQASMARNTPMG